MGIFTEEARGWYSELRTLPPLVAGQPETVDFLKSGLDTGIYDLEIHFYNGIYNEHDPHSNDVHTIAIVTSVTPPPPPGDKLTLTPVTASPIQ
jgi:hypothetical protein